METLYEKSSLILNPGVYDTGKVYCTKPFDGSGDLTFTRNSNATRVNADGLVEKVRTNVLLQSNQFDTTWLNINSTETGGQVGYDGTNNAWLLDKNGSNGRIQQGVSVSGVQTFSLYAKKGTSDYMRIYVDGSTADSYFDLTNGTFVSGSNYIAQSVTDVGGGWYRCSLSFNSSSTVRIYPAEFESVGGTSGNILIQDAQLETGDIATDYIPTTSAAVSVGPTANVPRLDYSGGGCPSLLLEPQRTQLFYDSTPRNFTNTSSVNRWVFGTNSPAVVNQAVGIFGTNSATKYTKTAGQTTSDFLYYSQAPVVSGSVYTISGYVKLGTASNAVFVINNTTAWNSVTGGTFVATAAGGYDEWKRFSITFTAPTSNKINLHIGYHQESGVEAQATGTFFVEGLQLELGSYETSLIPSLGASVTRLADFSEVTFTDNTIAPTANTTVFYEVQLTGLLDESPNTGGFNLKNQAGTNNRLNFNYGYGRIYSNYVSGSTTSFYDANAGDIIKVAFQLTNGGKSFVNGVHTHTTTRDWSTDTFGNPEFSYGHLVKQYIIFDSVLSDADCIKLTTP